LPALLTGIAAAVILSATAVLPEEPMMHRVILQAVAAEGVVFALPSLGMTPAAAVLTVVIARRKQWSSSVVWTLWVVVAVSLIMVLPASKVATAHYVYSTPRPAEASLVRK
jgi:hypothetical protein